MNHSFEPSLSTINESTPSFRNPIPSTSMDLPSVSPSSAPPPVPPRPQLNQLSPYSSNGFQSYGNGYQSYGGMNNYGLGGMYGNYGGGYNSFMGGGMSMPYGMGGFNRFGPYGGDMESRFIQMAEESSRPAFQSIESVVGAVGSVAMMLENTFIAMTSSFRAILGVAENFGRLRSLFAQFWSTFAVVRSLNWIIRKLLVMLGIRTHDEFRAWAEAVAATQNGVASPEQRSQGSSWPILMFFGVIFAAPYIILKLLSGLAGTINERLNDPSTWQTPMRAVVQHEYQASSPQELTLRTNEVIHLAPQHLQGQLWNSGWLMASADRRTAGLVPVNYIKVIRTSTTDEQNNKQTNQQDTNQYKFSYNEEM